MLYNIKNTSKFLESLCDKKSDGIESLYKALNMGGIEYASFCDIQSGVESQWTEVSTKEEFYDFWKSLLGTSNVARDPKNNSVTPKLSEGDVIILNPAISFDCVELSGTPFAYVLDVAELTNGNSIYTLISIDPRSQIVKKVQVNADNFPYGYNLLRFSNINHNLPSFYNLIFKGILNNQSLFVRLILSCCPETRNKDGSNRDNAYCSLFSKVSSNDLLETIESIAQRNSHTIDATDSVIKSFIECVLLNEKHEQPTEVIDKIVKELNLCKIKVKKISQPIVNRFLHEKPTKQLDSFFSDRSNRRLFQERFSLVLQLCFLIISGKDKSLFNISVNSPEEYTGWTTRIKEYITLESKQFDRISHIVRYLTNNTLYSDIYVDSLFSLSGYVFDSIGSFSEDNRTAMYEEFGRFQEFAKCYGARTLDYFFALQRYKDVNQFCAIELSNIYYFGWEFEGYKIEKSRSEAISLLNSCKDYSVTARWSLGENYKWLAKKYQDYIDTFTIDRIQSEMDQISAGCCFSEPFSEYLKMCNMEYEQIHDLECSQISILLNRIAAEEKNRLLKKSQDLYVSCGWYPPALNSVANYNKFVLFELMNAPFNNPDHIEQIACKAIAYAIAAARYGWVYAYNNLFALLNNEKVVLILESSEKGNILISEAYQVLKPLKGDLDNAVYSTIIASGSDLSAETMLPRAKSEEQFDRVKSVLINGVEISLPNYNNDIVTFNLKYFEPIKNPINFLVVSAYLNNIYGLNHLGIELLKLQKECFKEVARKCFECAGLYKPVGLFNLATKIYYSDNDKYVKLLTLAADRGHLESKSELKRYFDSTRPSDSEDNRRS